jgi:4-hydroxybenzoate polyprenyltransferase
LLNDLWDRPGDRMHPVKRLRAIASGRLPAAAAYAAAGVLLAAGLAIVAAVQADIRPREHLMGGYALAAWAVAYVALNLLYSTWLKKIVVVDVLVVAMGFVLRAMAGAAAIVVPVSPWLVVCTLSLCLFIAVTKRRGEIAELPDGQAGSARAVNRRYEPRLIELMLNVSAAMAILTYTLYCLAPRTTQRLGSAHMVWTVPLVIYGMFRYYRITSSAAGSDPVRVLVRDRVMWLVLAAYVLLCVLVLKFGSFPAVRDILDFQLP